MAVSRSKARWVGIVAVLLFTVGALYRLFGWLTEPGRRLELGQLLLPALSLALVGLALALAGVLIRNLVRLIVDRKRGILGSRLRTKLVFFFLALVLLPALVLFYGSATVVKQSVDAVLRTPLEELTRTSGAIVEEWRDYLQSEALDLARAISREIDEGDYLAATRREDLSALLQRWQLHERPHQLRVSRGTSVIAEFGAGGEADRERGAELAAVLDALAARVADLGHEEARIDYLGDGLLAHAAVLVGDAEAGGDGERYVVSVGIVLPARLAGNLEGIDRAARIYRQFRVQRRELVRLYLTLIGLVFLTTLFVATWMGFYLARRITGPIQQLADATREIAAGNLDVRVTTEIGDELGMLVEAFNHMAVELQENREVITRSTADLRRSNLALDERRRYIETLLANLSTAVVSLDPRGRVTTANPAVSLILGIGLEVGDDARGKLRIHGLEPLADLLEREFARKGGSIRKDLALDMQGVALNVAVQVSPLRDGAGKHMGTLVMVEDLTELMRAQRVAAWREVARRIAHEIKNPLTPIQLWAQRLRKKVVEAPEDLGQLVPEAAASIEREVGALKQLVDEFSLFARMPEIRPRLVDLATVVESVLTLYKGLADIRWSIDIEPGLPAAKLDPDQIRRVLINLVENSVAATEGHGEIRIAARRIDDGEWLRVEVADDGPGIDPADRDTMFSPYFSTKKRGTGLGLAIVHKVVTDHHGSIRVEPNQPSGARFVIELPALERRGHTADGSASGY